jgi:hypothetical protein
MSKFQKRIESKIRINGLEKAFIDVIEDFSNENPGLTKSEVHSVMLKLLTTDNDKELMEEV